MRRLTTIICCMAFALSGICLATMTSKSDLTTSSVQAATLPTIDMSKMSLPLDLQLNQTAQNKDSTVSVKTDTVYVEKTKLVKVSAPHKVKTKTVHVPVLYIATRTDNKEDTVNCDSTTLYKVHKVGTLDLNKVISSVDVNQHYILTYNKIVGEYVLQVSTYSRSHQPMYENLLDPRICQLSQKVRYPKGRMKCILCEK